MDLIYPDEAYQLVGLAMQVHRELGCGFLKLGLLFNFGQTSLVHRRIVY